MNPNMSNTVSAQKKCGVYGTTTPVGELRNTVRRQSEQQRALAKDFGGSRGSFQLSKGLSQKVSLLQYSLVNNSLGKLSGGEKKMAKFHEYCLSIYCHVTK